jgi:hypothetical protein
MNDKTIFFNRIAHLVIQQIGKFTPQLFIVESHDPADAPSAWSTGILLKRGLDHFLLTAGHSLYEEDLNKIGIMQGHDFYTIGGDIKIYEPNKEEYDPRLLDMAVIHLDEEAVVIFRNKYDFLDWTKVAFGHVSAEITPYIVFGYPEVYTKHLTSSKKIVPSALKFRTHGKPYQSYQQHDINPTKTLIVSANQKYVGQGISDRGEMPELGGISGCGLWLVSDLYASQPQFHLVSIITGEDENQELLYSSKIDFLQVVLRDFDLSKSPG